MDGRRRLTGRVRQAARRLLRVELQGAIDAAEDDRRPRGERIHDVRTALKRARALLRLVSSLLGRRGREERRRLAAIARQFGAVRDAEVAVETIDRLLPLLGGQSSALSALRIRAVAEWRALERRAETAQDLRRASRALALARRRAERLFDRARGQGGRAVADGFVREYGKARQAMKDADRLHTPLAFHVWRKGVKIHAYHVKVLTNAGVKEMASRRDSLDALGSLLGEGHDLTVFEATIRAEQPRLGHSVDCERLLAVIETRQRDIHRRVKQLGRRLFVDRPSMMRRKLRPRPL